MKFNLIISFKTAVLALLVCFAFDSIVAKAAFQDEGQEELDPLRFYQAKYEAEYSEPIQLVVDAVNKSIEDINCVVTKNAMKTDRKGRMKAIVRSDYCVFAEGDSTFKLLKKYSYKIPHIKGGSWINGRMQYKFMVKEKNDSTVYLLLKGQMSGFENTMTNRVHFWKSNGMFEHRMLESIKENIKALKEENEY